MRMKSAWTDNERRGLLVFLCIEIAVMFGLGQIGACFSSMGNNLDTFGDAFVKGAAKTGTWFGALSIPASIAWMSWGAVSRNRERPRSAEIAKVFFFELVVIVFLAVFFVELAPLALERAPKWSDLIVFGGVFFVASALSAVSLFAFGVGTSATTARRQQRSLERTEDVRDTSDNDSGEMT
jgi:hypothetical protein